jgi:hypothetical protein
MEKNKSMWKLTVECHLKISRKRREKSERENERIKKKEILETTYQESVNLWRARTIQSYQLLREKEREREKTNQKETASYYNLYRPIRREREQNIQEHSCFEQRTSGKCTIVEKADIVIYFYPDRDTKTCIDTRADAFNISINFTIVSYYNTQVQTHFA